MRQDAKNLLAAKGESPIKDAIVKSIRDFKRLGDSKSEVLETLTDIFGDYFTHFIKSQISQLM